MTIEVNYNPIRQQGNGVTKDFSYDFYALSDQYLVVYIEEDGVQTVTTDYTATVSETGGIVTFNVAPTENQYVVITRSTTINQEVPYTTSRGFDAKVVESSFDKDIAISQELQNQLTRTPKLPEGYNYNVQLPNNPDDGKALVWSGSEGKMRNSDYTLEESMVRAAASAELSKDWAEKTTGLVSGDFSSKAYAIGGTGTETNNAKYYASQASNSADIAYAAATNENVVAVGTDLRTDNNIGAVAGNATNINNVAGNATNINNVASNRTNINAVAGSIANVNTTATNINAVNTAANNIVAIQNASANAQLARDWAVKMNGLVAGEDYSAKYWADQARQSAAGAVVDNISINRNTDDELQAIGVINQNATTTAIKTWTGTKAQYDTLKNNIRYYAWGGNSYYTTVAPDSIQTSDKLYNSSGVELTYTIDAVSYNSTLNQYEMTIEDSDGLYYELIRNSLTTLYDITDIDNNTLYHITDDESDIYDKVSNIINRIYPIGSIYLTVSNDNPATLLGLGTWQKVASGRVLQGSDSNHNAGTTVAAGLPNITGKAGGGLRNYSSDDNGALYGSNNVHNGPVDGNYDIYDILNFDASRSNSIYGQSNTVQPPAYVVNIWQRVA